AAEAQQLGARALTEPRLDLALLLARQADALDPSIETYGNLLAAELRAPAAVAVMRPWDGKFKPGVGSTTIPVRETCVDVSPDGHTLAAGDLVGGLVLLDARTYATLGQIDVRLVTCRDHAFSPDGTTFATIAWAGQTRHRVALVDVASRTLRKNSTWLAQGRSATGALAYSPDGRTILTVEQAKTELILVRRDAATGRPLGPGVPVRSPGWRLDESERYWVWAGYTRDGKEVVLSALSGPLGRQSSPGRTLVLDAQSLQPLRSYHEGSYIAALSPGGRTLALGRNPGGDQVTLLDVRTGHARVLPGRQRDTVEGIDFSPDGRNVVTGGSDGSAIVWDASTGEPRQRLDGHTGQVFNPAFAPDGKTVFSAGLDQSVIAWDLAGDRRLGRSFPWAPAAKPPQAAVFPGTALSPDGTVLYRGSPDGRVLAVGVPDGASRWEETVWSAARLSRLLREEARVLAAPDMNKLGERKLKGKKLEETASQLKPWVASLPVPVAVSPDGTKLAAANQFGEVALLDAATGHVLRIWTANVVRYSNRNTGPESVGTVAFTTDGRDLVTANDDGRAVIWDVETGKKVAALTLPRKPSRNVLAALPSPDGREIALLTSPNIFAKKGYRGPDVPRVGVWSVETGRPLWERDVGRNFWAQPGLAALPDWSLLATVGFFRQVRLWDVRTGDPVGDPIIAGEGFVISASFDPTGRRLLTGETDGTARVFDVVSHEQVGAPLPGIGAWWTTALFGPGGKTVLTLSGNGQAASWDLSVDGLRAQACRTANRVLTEDEWRRFLPGRRYAPACRH
ncbi:MAG TPA: PQQ-binding-like beta-propeller repeat protein, partial [Gaiellaceae bacterium]|nr:PQQ-binding-like beta-propeller repeat protein [Gaiellaceae bacterium]